MPPFYIGGIGIAYKDIVNKSMFSNPIFVADVFNQLYFGGEPVVNPSHMIDGPIDLCLFQKKKTVYEVTK